MSMIGRNHFEPRGVDKCFFFLYEWNVRKQHIIFQIQHYNAKISPSRHVHHLCRNADTTMTLGFISIPFCTCNKLNRVINDLFQPRTKNRIFRHSAGYLNCINIITHGIILMGLPRFHETTFQIIISGQTRALELLSHTNYYMDGMNQM